RKPPARYWHGSTATICWSQGLYCASRKPFPLMALTWLLADVVRLDCRARPSWRIIIVDCRLVFRWLCRWACCWKWTGFFLPEISFISRKYFLAAAFGRTAEASCAPTSITYWITIFM